MKKRKGLFVASSLLCLALVAGGLASCGGGAGAGSKGDTTYGDGSNFLAWLGRGEGAEKKRIDSGNECVLISGESGISVNGYDILAEGAAKSSLSYEVKALDGGPEVKVSEEGAVSVPVVTEEHNYSIVVKSTLGSVVSTATAITVRIVPKSSVASGIKDFSGLSGEEKLGLMEQLDGYTVAHGTAGVTLRSNGGHALYNSRVSTPLLTANKYILGYGWGIDQYGTISSPLSAAAEPNEKYREYFHSYTENNPSTLNSENASNASTSDLETPMMSSYFTYRLNKTNDAKEQVGVLSREKDGIPLNMESGKATKWKVKLRVGADADGENGATKGLTYRTTSTVPAVAAFEKRKIALEDYLTMWKLLLTQAVGYSRGTEAVASGNNSLLVGSADYFKGTEKVTDFESTGVKSLWDKVGVKVDPSDNSINFEFVNGITQDFFAYYIDSYTSNPIPMDFIKAIATEGTTETEKIISGAKNYGTFVNVTPVNTHLSVGPFMLEYYESQKKYVYGKNEDWFEKTDDYGRALYQLKGYVYGFNQENATSPTAWYDAFVAGYIDSTSIPGAKWNDKKTDSALKTIPGSASSNLRLNTVDEKNYEMLFGKEGLINRARSLHTSEEKYYQVKPIMANRNFLYALNTSINRKELCDIKGYVPSADFYGGLQQMSPASTQAYLETDAHKNAIKSVYGEGGINLASNEAGYGYLKKAIEEELLAGHYKLGTTAEPTVINFNIKATSSWFTSWYTEVAKLWEAAFADTVSLYGAADQNETGTAWVEGGKPLIKLDVEELTPASDDDTTANNFIFYEGQMVGDFDSGIGYITGGAYDTYDFTRLQRAYNDPAELVLSWAGDTRTVSQRVKYEGQYYSFDGLFLAGSTGILLDNLGYEATPVDMSVGADTEFALSTSTSVYTLKAAVNYKEIEGVEYTVDLAGTTISLADDNGLSDGPYALDDLEATATLSEDKAELTFTISKNGVDAVVTSFNDWFVENGKKFTVGELSITVSVPVKVTNAGKSIDLFASFSGVIKGLK